MSVKRLSAHRRDGRGLSLGRIERPVGIDTTSVVPAVKMRRTSLTLSQYSRAADARDAERGGGEAGPGV
jgi:hypothetical protein